jgi:hypothetical protein
LVKHLTKSNTGRSYGRALFIIAAVQSVALLTENVYDE